MVDISKCNGHNCPIKQNCKRFTAKSNKLYQSYLVEPYKINEETNSFSCSMFWGDTQESIMFQLESIMKGKK